MSTVGTIATDPHHEATHTDGVPAGASVEGSRRRRRVRRTVAAVGLGMALAVTPAVMPDSAPVPSVLQAAPAQAASGDCVKVARRVFVATRGNLRAALDATRFVNGCGNATADAICNATRQPWGGFFRWLVWTITGGISERC